MNNPAINNFSSRYTIPSRFQSGRERIQPRRVRFLTVQFAACPALVSVPDFARALLHKADIRDQGFRKGYPLIQFSLEGSNPVMLCIDRYADIISPFFSRPDRTLELGGGLFDPVVENVDVNQVLMGTWNRLFFYETKNWIPFRAEEYEDFKKMISYAQRVHILEEKLYNDVFALARALHISDADNLQVMICAPEIPQFIHLNDIEIPGYHIQFTTNSFLPDGIHIGLGAERGCGRVQSIAEEEE